MNLKTIYVIYKNLNKLIEEFVQNKIKIYSEVLYVWFMLVNSFNFNNHNLSVHSQNGYFDSKKININKTESKYNFKFPEYNFSTL